MNELRPELLEPLPDDADGGAGGGSYARAQAASDTHTFWWYSPFFQIPLHPQLPGSAELALFRLLSRQQTILSILHSMKPAYYSERRYLRRPLVQLIINSNFGGDSSVRPIVRGPHPLATLCLYHLANARNSGSYLQRCLFEMLEIRQGLQVGT